jgi:hypothetical protein
LERGTKIITIFCEDYIGDASRRPTENFDSKGENTMEYKLGMITRI